MLTLVPNTTAHFGLHMESWRMNSAKFRGLYEATQDYM